MNLNFYQTINEQPDLQDVALYLNTPLKKIMGLYETIKNNKSIDSVQIKHTIDKIINKHFPTLVDSYCALGLEYRNNAIIKNDNDKTYTSKDILLKNVGKLIEEIDILIENNTNIYEDINLDDFIEIQKNTLQYEPEQSQVMSNSYNVKSDIYLQQRCRLKEHKRTFLDEIDSFLGDQFGQLFMTIAFMTFSTIGVYMVYDKVQEANRAQIITENFSTNIYDIKLGTSYNIYGGKTIITETTLNNNNDGLSIKMQEVTDKGCSKIAKILQQKHIKKLKINDKFMIEDGFINEKDLESTCSLDKNTLEIIDYKKYM